MEKKLLFGLWALILLLLASAALALTVQYINPATGNVIKSSAIDAITSSFVPEAELDMKIIHEGVFVVTIPSLNISRFNPLNISFRNLSIAGLDSAANNIGSGRRYKLLDAYAFDVGNSSEMDRTFTIEFSYGGLDVGDASKLRMFRADFNFTSNTTDFGNFASVASILDAPKIRGNVAGFSIFMLAEDTYVPPAPTPPPPSGAPSGRAAPSGIFIPSSIVRPNVTEPPEEEEPEGAVEIIEPTVPPVEQMPAIIPRDLIAPTPEPKPIDIWALIFGIAFIVVLIGGVAIYRHAHMTGMISLPGEEPPLPAVPVAAEQEEQQPSLLQRPFIVEEAVEEVKGSKEQIGEEKSQIIMSEAKKGKPTMAISPAAMEKLANYIHTEEDRHFTREMITNALLKKRWPRKAIEDAFEIVDSMKRSISPSTLDKLHKYIMREFGKGFGEAQINNALMTKGWPEFIVNEAFKRLRELEHDLKEANLHVVSYNLEGARENAKKLIEKGYKKKKLYRALLLAGWPSDAAKSLVK